MATRRVERIVTIVFEIVAATLVAVLAAANQAPGESLLAPAFLGIMVAVLLDQVRTAGLMRLSRIRLRRRNLTRAEYPRP